MVEPLCKNRRVKKESTIDVLEAVVQRCSVRKVFLEILQNSQENTCTRVSFLIKLQACNFIEKDTLAPVSFAKLLRTTLLQSTSGQLLVEVLFCFVHVILIANQAALEKNPVAIERVGFSFSINCSFNNTFSL